MLPEYDVIVKRQLSPAEKMPSHLGPYPMGRWAPWDNVQGVGWGEAIASHFSIGAHLGLDLSIPALSAVTAPSRSSAAVLGYSWRFAASIRALLLAGSGNSCRFIVSIYLHPFTGRRQWG